MAELNCQVANGLLSYMFVLLKIAHNYSLWVRSANKRRINNSIPVTQGQDTISSAKATSFPGNSIWLLYHWTVFDAVVLYRGERTEGPVLKTLDLCDALHERNAAVSKPNSNPKFKFPVLKDVDLQNHSSHKDFNNSIFKWKLDAFKMFAILWLQGHSLCKMLKMQISSRWNELQTQQRVNVVIYKLCKYLQFRNTTSGIKNYWFLPMHTEINSSGIHSTSFSPVLSEKNYPEEVTKSSCDWNPG